MTRLVGDVDWESWEPTIRATLLFVVRDDEILLIHKKRGIGAGKINGPGGKIDPGETAMECAIRETEEELHITATGVVEAGRLWFDFLDGTRIHGIVFRADDFEGEPTETDEAIPLWFPVDQIPFDQMWADDELWFPSLLDREPFELRATFDDDRLLDASFGSGVAGVGAGSGVAGNGDGVGSGSGVAGNGDGVGSGSGVAGNGDGEGSGSGVAGNGDGVDVSGDHPTR